MLANWCMCVLIRAALALFISVLVVCVPATRGVLCLSLLLMGLLVLLVCVRAVIRRAVSCGHDMLVCLSVCVGTVFRDREHSDSGNYLL